MVMADFYDRDRGRRRRRRGGGRRGGDRDRGYYGDRERDDDDEDFPQSYPTKILAKPFTERNSENNVLKNHVRDTQSPKPNSQPENSKPIIMLKSHDDSRPKIQTNSVIQPNITNLLANDTMPAHVYKEKKTPLPSGPVTIEGNLQSRLGAPPEMTRCMKLIDENMNWCENPVGMMLDQTDFLTVGVLGLQGVGKSTITSILAGNYTHDPAKSFVFKPQCKEVRDVCSHQTMGVDMFVTGERVIVLDTQPMLSASVLDYMIHNDKKYSTDYNTVENCIEIQSLQVASFMMTVCNVVLVVVDWFADVNFLRLIETAEMLKPATPSSGQENSHDTGSEYYPHIVFVLNKAESEDFSLENYNTMQSTLAKVFEQSKAKNTGGLNMVSAGLMPKKRGKKVEKDINLFLLPSYHDDNTKEEGQGQKESKDALFSLMSEYRGHHTFAHSTQKLRNSLLAMPRQLLTHTTLSEKNWFHYAARSWDGIKKSVMFSEYNRLLP